MRECRRIAVLGIKTEAQRGAPAFYVQLEELRSGEWVTEPAARGRPRRQDLPVSEWCAY